MAPGHPVIRPDADIPSVFQQNWASTPAGGYLAAAAGIHGYPSFKWTARHGLAGWNVFLPAGKPFQGLEKRLPKISQRLPGTVSRRPLGVVD
ncbi:hypothetical protein PGTUg99_016360 [Puccinia graminis f. sp. tritici]|uniref:Uncharacterized protein n=1 Tax=Puccinia graminis f. sp. tritici TaxID=56615 RepID=A0A5B0RTD1_PUCGR|nr:hypothetical protein PGTUg99_016360 [Puccinia graminis f. sp. tritici]